MKKAIKIVSIIDIIIIFIITCITIYRNSYGTEMKPDDIYCQSYIEGDDLVIKIIPRIDIKNLEYDITPEGKKTSHFKQEHVKANQEIIHRFELDPNNKTFDRDLSVTNGKIRNKDANKTRAEIKKSTACTFEYYIAYGTKSDTYNGKYYTYEDYKIYAEITNNTNKNITSIYGALMDGKINNNDSCTIGLTEINFKTPLKPNEKRTVYFDENQIDFQINDNYKTNIEYIKKNPYEVKITCTSSEIILPVYE